MNHEEKIALSVVGIGAAALVVYLLARSPSATVDAGGQILPVGAGGVSPDTFNIGGSGDAPFNFPGINIPGLVNNGVPYIGSGPLPGVPNLTVTNPYASQCTCAGVGLNQIYFASVPALVAAQQAPPAPAAAADTGPVAAIKRAASYFTIPAASTVGIPEGGQPALPTATEGLSYV